MIYERLEHLVKESLRRTIDELTGIDLSPDSEGMPSSVDCCDFDKVATSLSTNLYHLIQVENPYNPEIQ